MSSLPTVSAPGNASLAGIPATSGTSTVHGLDTVHGTIASPGGQAARSEVPAIYEFSATSSFSRLKLMPALNDVQWGGVESLGADLLARLERAPSGLLLVDLSPLTYMGSSQVALLVRLWKSLKNRSGRMAVWVTSDMVYKVLTIAGLSTLWDIVRTEADAYDALGVGELVVGRSGSSGFSWAAPLSVLFLAGSAGLWGAGLTGFQGLTLEARLGTQLGLGGAALACALWAVARGAGASRILGFLVTFASFLIAIVTALQWPR